MICEKCKNREAVIRLTQIVSDAKNTLNLCQHCAENHGLENSMQDVSKVFGKLIINILSDLIKIQEKEIVKPQIANTVCGNCGLTFEEFHEKGRLGCADCYVFFHDELKIILRRLHGSNQHIFKEGDHRPRSTMSLTYLLNKKLKQAIYKENYEQAAEIRDQIFAIQQDIES